MPDLTSCCRVHGGYCQCCDVLVGFPGLHVTGVDRNRRRASGAFGVRPAGGDGLPFLRKKGYGFHPLCVFADHGPAGTGEPLAILLRPGNAGSNTAADHISVLRQAFTQLPGLRSSRPGKKVLVRVDGAGHSHQLIGWLTGQRVQYSLGWTLPGDAGDLIEKISASMWQPAYDADGDIRDGAWVAELTGLLDLGSWPAGIRVIARKERPHPGAQLTITDVDGHRITAFATNTTTGQLADLELRHRRRARPPCLDRLMYI